jgi:hypothetical protein
MYAVRGTGCSMRYSVQSVIGGIIRLTTQLLQNIAFYLLSMRQITARCAAVVG